MQRKNIKSVLDKISSGDFDSQEEEIAKYWIHQLNPKKQSGYSDEDLERVSEEMWGVLAQAELSQPAKVRKLWPRMVAVAAAMALMVLGVYFFNYYSSKVSDEANLIAQDVDPGKMGATLTLANGKKIRLTDAANGELAKEAGVVITKSADGQLVYDINPALSKSGISSQGGKKSTLNTLSTARGETYQLRLPDGSLVWLNAASSLTYATALNEHGVRKVRLEGEAYFEIAKLTRSTLAGRGIPPRGEERVPFIVETDKQKVEVLGTHFNINSYRDEELVKTTLLEGSVRVSRFSPVGGDAGTTTGINNQMILKPNQQSVLSNNEIKIKQVNAEDAVAWKNGLFVFEDESLESIMRKVARWYNVEVVYTPGIDKNELYYGSVSRYDNVSKVIETLELTKGIHFKIEGRRITVMK